jgi:hypothetical protein
MKITEIHVGFEETCSLPDYSNVRPSVRYSANLEEGDDPDQVRQTLFEKARGIVRQEVDEALVRNGRPPKYYDGKKGDCLINRQMQAILVIDNIFPAPDGFYLYGERFEGLPWEMALQWGHHIAEQINYQLIEAPDGQIGDCQPAGSGDGQAELEEEI